MTETGKNSKRMRLSALDALSVDWIRRATYIKGDPYIRDMKHTRSIIHMHHLQS